MSVIFLILFGICRPRAPTVCSHVYILSRFGTLEDEECTHGVSVYDYPMIVGSAPSEGLQEGSQFG